MTHRISKGAYIAGRDLQLLINIALLVIVAVLIPNPPVEADEAKNLGNMVITATWAPGPVDVDLWVQAPGDRPVGYSNKAGHTVNLLRDDLGTTQDAMPLNYETTISRGLPAGEYIVNVHAYSTTQPTPVEVEIRFGMKDTKLFVTETLTLAPRQERTVIRFRLDDKGAVVPGSVNRVFAPLRSANK